MKEILIVTGSTGHLGNTIINDLIKRGKKVRALVLYGEDCSMIKNELVEIFYGDIRDKESFKSMFEKKEDQEIIVIHTAVIVSIETKKNNLIEEVNVGGCKNIVELSIENKVSKFIYISSVHAIYEKENNDIIYETFDFDDSKIIGQYAKSKAKATRYVLDSLKNGLNAIVLHPSGIIGPNDYGKSNTTALVEEYINGKLTARVNGGYDFVDVRDVSNAVINSVYMGKIGECYILSGHYITVKEFFEIMKKITGKRSKVTVLPMWFAKFTIPLAEIYYKLLKKPPIYSKYSLHTLKSNSNFSNNKAMKELDFRPREVYFSIEDSIKFLASQKRLKSTKIRNYIFKKRIKCI